MNTTVPDRLTKRADQLSTADVIAEKFLPYQGQAAPVIFTYRYFRNNRWWVFVAYIDRLGVPDGAWFLADAEVPVQPGRPVPAGVEGGPVGSGPERHTGGA